MSADPIEQLSDQDLERFAGPLAEYLAEEMKPTLTPMTPQEAVDKYFETRDFNQNTERTVRSSLQNHFVPWCEDNADIQNMNDLSGSDLADYRVWRRDEASDRVEKLKPKTEATQQTMLRKFLEYCEGWDVVQKGLHEYVLIPRLTRDDEVKDEVLDGAIARRILKWLNRYEYASCEHVMWTLLAACGARVGGIHSLDLDDYVTDDEGAYIKFRHRPETETRLKNEVKGERDVDITPNVKEVLDAYIEDQRIDNVDDFGRKPLLTTTKGRLAKVTMRNYVYWWTRPCATGESCPYGREVEECRAARRKNYAFSCPDSLSCHPVRKGYITEELKSGVPKEVLVERCDVSEKMLDKHYDHRTKKEKMEARRALMELAHQRKKRYGE